MIFGRNVEQDGPPRMKSVAGLGDIYLFFFFFF